MKKLFILFAVLILASQCVNAGEVSTEALLQYNQGIDYYKMGQYDNSISAFRSAIRIDPNFIDAYYNLGSVLEYLKQYDAALAVFKQIIVRKPEDYDSVYKAAWLSYKLGEGQKARTYLSIIPSDCARAKDAKTLSEMLGPQTPAPAVVKEVPLESKGKISQSSGIYQNIAAPTGIATDAEGNIYVAEFNNNSIVKITPDEKRLVYLKDAKISGPIGLAMDKSKNMYIANYNKDNILKVSSLGEVSVLISNLKKPYYLYIEGNMLFISCQGSDSVLRYKLP